MMRDQEAGDCIEKFARNAGRFRMLAIPLAVTAVWTTLNLVLNSRGLAFDPPPFRILSWLNAGAALVLLAIGAWAHRRRLRESARRIGEARERHLQLQQLLGDDEVETILRIACARAVDGVHERGAYRPRDAGEAADAEESHRGHRAADRTH